MKTGIMKALFLLATLGLLCAPAIMAESPEAKGLRIMTQMDNAPIFERIFSNTYLHIYNKQGKKISTQKTRVGTYWENFRDPKNRLNRSIAYFYSPADGKGNATLIIEHADKEDEQWVYLRGLNKPKRIIASDKSSSFMGSDFTHGDISPRKLDDFTYRWLGTETIPFKGKKVPTEKIEVLFKSEKESQNYGYKKFVVYATPKYGLYFKIEIYNLNEQLYKVMTLNNFIIKKNVDGKKVFLPVGLQMKNLLEGTKTVMSMPTSAVKVEKGAASKIKPRIFRVSYLTRKWW